jgi:uncharacterized membrane protein YcaP (DUF421 family)
MAVDWDTLFALDHAWELVVRGSAMYWFLFLLFRLVLRRDVGALGIADVLLLVLIADAAQNAMAGGYESVGDGMVLVGTIAGWNLLMDWVSFRFPATRRLLEPGPLVLVRSGRLLRRNMRREFVTTDEIMGQLRQHGIEKLSQVKLASMEPDGSISIIRADDGDDDQAPATGPQKTI